MEINDFVTRNVNITLEDKGLNYDHFTRTQHVKEHKSTMATIYIHLSAGHPYDYIRIRSDVWNHPCF